MPVLTYPNAITVLRFPLAAAFLLADGTGTRAAIIAAGGLSDWLDGWLSRRLDQRSGFGELVDPLADKTFLLVVLGTFWLEGRLAGWELAFLLVRDVVTAAAFVVARLFRLPLRFRSRWSGKLVTTLQVSAALGLLLLPRIGHALVWAGGIAGLVAVVDYGRAAARGLHHPAASA